MPGLQSLKAVLIHKRICNDHLAEMQSPFEKLMWYAQLIPAAIRTARGVFAHFSGECFVYT